MKEVTAYMTVDGSLYLDFYKAQEHEETYLLEKDLFSRFPPLTIEEIEQGTVPSVERKLAWDKLGRCVSCGADNYKSAGNGWRLCVICKNEY